MIIHINYITTICIHYSRQSSRLFKELSWHDLTESIVESWLLVPSQPDTLKPSGTILLLYTFPVPDHGGLSEDSEDSHIQRHPNMEVNHVESTNGPWRKYPVTMSVRWTKCIHCNYLDHRSQYRSLKHTETCSVIMSGLRQIADLVLGGSKYLAVSSDLHVNIFQ